MRILVSRRRATPEGLEAVLGEPFWQWEEVTARKASCGLATGPTLTAGWGSFKACCRIHIHPDGICLYGGLGLPDDEEFARLIADKLDVQFEEVQR